MLTRLLIRTYRSALFWSWLNAALRVGAALLVLPLAVRIIPPDELGLWYVFIALGGMAGLLELGFRQSVSLNTSYLWAGAASPRSVGLPALADSTEPSPERLAPLVQTFVLFYRIVALFIFIALLIGGGAWIWHKTASIPDHASLRAAWLLFAAGFAVNFSGSVWSAFLIGINRYRETQQSQLVAALAGLLVSIFGLLTGWKLWSLVAGQAITGLLSWILVRRKFIETIPELRSNRGSADWELMRTMWPFAWRVGVGGFGAFLVTHANTLICSAFLDLRTTASYGLCMQLAGTLSAISAMWVQVKLPVFAQQRIREGNRALARLFIGRIACFLATFLLGAMALLAIGPAAMDFIEAKTPLLPTGLLAVLLLVVLLEAHHSQYAALVLTENRNPFVVIGLVSGAAAAALSVVLVQQWGVWGLIAAPGIVQACGNNWWVVWRGIRGMDLTVREYFRSWRTLWIG